MKIITRIMVTTMVIVSNPLFAQDTTHTKLVDKYYPESKTPEPATSILDKATSAPLNTNLSKPTSTTVSQPPQINKIENPESTQVPGTPLPQAQATQNTIYNNSNGTNTSNQPINSNSPAPIYRDTRLGSSSPLYNTYEKNDNGAGAITTNPNKG